MRIPLLCLGIMRGFTDKTVNLRVELVSDEPPVLVDASWNSGLSFVLAQEDHHPGSVPLCLLT